MLSPGQLYHVYNHAIGNENLFITEENYSYFLKKYVFHLVPFVNTISYCLMPNHFHIVLRIKNEEELKEIINGMKIKAVANLPGFLSQKFSNFFNSYSKAYNKLYDRRGALFLHNFKAKPILSTEQLIRTVLYIHLNPVKHGFNLDYLSWKWSSLLLHFSDEKPVWLYSEEILELLNDKITYLKVHKERCDELTTFSEE